MNQAVLRTEVGPAGEVLHLMAAPPRALPSVAKRDLEQAWEAARAKAAAPAPVRWFRFAGADGAAVQLLLNDRDAAAWAAAVDRVADLCTPHGVSVCLRLLALVALMSRAESLRPWFTLSRAGVEIHGSLFQAAAVLPLNEALGFDEAALHALLPQPKRQG